MYFCKRLKMQFAKEIKESNSFYFEVKLGLKDLTEEKLLEGIASILSSFSEISQSRYYFFKKIPGSIRKLVIDCDLQTKLYSPYLDVLLQLDFFKIADENFDKLTECKIRLMEDTLYYKWFKLWVSILKMENVFFDFKMLKNKEEALLMMNKLCTNERKENEIIKNICKVKNNHHQLYGFHGTFRKILLKDRKERKL